ncbi:hypothetical protein [Dyadobacter tibetensis]|uniref:hypothetical protein n=1 Tax=Dyadobacter tibetensis TaxID=1211851 RepID=UPI000470360A|nr:hypothetical protein [Dyadobacter tibetensis]
MRYACLIACLFISHGLWAQHCPVLTQTLAVIDSMQVDSSRLFQFRFKEKQLNTLAQWPGQEVPVRLLGELQHTLNEDGNSLKEKHYWLLDEKLAEKQLDALQKLCPQTRFGVYQREMDYYRRRYTARK